jgi:hypothetical protein
MIYHMTTRTTLILDQQRLVELKKLAAVEQRTLSDLVDEFLRSGLEQRKNPRRRRMPVVLPGFSMGRPRVHLADRDQLLELMEK